MNFFSGKKDKTNKTLIEKIILEKYNQYYRLAYSYVHNEADANDIVQTGAYKALRSSHTLKEPEFAETWVYRIMLNECLRQFKHPRFLSYEAMQEEKGGEFEGAEDSYTDIDLQRALDALEEKDKAIIIFKYFVLFFSILFLSSLLFLFTFLCSPSFLLFPLLIFPLSFLFLFLSPLLFYYSIAAEVHP